MEIFKITIGKARSEFSMIGLADINKGTRKYQGLVNGVPFIQGNDYETVRATVMDAVNLNQPELNQELN